MRERKEGGRGLLPSRSAIVAGLLAASLLGRAAPAVAQSPDPAEPEARYGFEVTGFVSALAPLAKLVSNEGGASAELSSSAGLGAALGYFLPNGFGVGAWGVWVPADISVTAVDPDTGFPSTSDLGDADYVAAVASLMYRPNLAGTVAVLQPFFSVGAGIRRLSLSAEDESVVNDATDFVGTVAAGADVDLSTSLALWLEVRDAISEFESEALELSTLQNDITISVGLGVRLR